MPVEWEVVDRDQISLPLGNDSNDDDIGERETRATRNENMKERAPLVCGTGGQTWSHVTRSVQLPVREPAESCTRQT